MFDLNDDFYNAGTLRIIYFDGTVREFPKVTFDGVSVCNDVLSFETLDDDIFHVPAVSVASWSFVQPSPVINDKYLEDMRRHLRGE